MASEPSSFRRIGNCNFSSGFHFLGAEGRSQSSPLGRGCEGHLLHLSAAKGSLSFSHFPPRSPAGVWSPPACLGHAQGSQAMLSSLGAAQCQGGGSDLPCCPLTPSIPWPPPFPSSPFLVAPQRCYRRAGVPEGRWDPGAGWAGAGKNSSQVPCAPAAVFLLGKQEIYSWAHS